MSDTLSQSKNVSKIPVNNGDVVLRLTEIFYSLQGEADTTGAPTIFIRLTGCPLRCVYCDTTYSFYGGDKWTLTNILEHIVQYPCKRVCVTGGEPLAQKKCLDLMDLLIAEGYEVSLETAGALSLEHVPVEVSKVMDVKTPSSGEEKRNHWQNIDYLTQHDQIKFVIMNREDYEWSLAKVKQYDLIEKVNTVWFSPMFAIDENSEQAQLPKLATELAEWILADGIDVRLQLQLHKLLWADAMGK